MVPVVNGTLAAALPVPAGEKLKSADVLSDRNIDQLMKFGSSPLKPTLLVLPGPAVTPRLMMFTPLGSVTLPRVAGPGKYPVTGPKLIWYVPAGTFWNEKLPPASVTVLTLIALPR